jgi:arsenate reductase (thioredoxin)
MSENIANKTKVLFVCVHNSARSQMAEAWLNRLCPERFKAESAGLEPGTLNPLAVEVMREVGIDISKNQTKSVFEMVKSGRLFGYVVTVCDETNAERCPIFPGFTKMIHWSFADPSALTGTREERLAGTRAVRDEIYRKIMDWCAELKQGKK